MEEWSEILLIDKPAGITSFDVIRRLRQTYSFVHNGTKAPRMGHAGTLDPLATGLMIIGIGSGTKKLSEYIKLDKEYIAEVLLGESRSTDDMEGKVTSFVKVTEDLSVLKNRITKTLNSMIGKLTLPVSVYSAIKKGGIPMYKRARTAEKKGEELNDVPMREMEVYEAELLSINSNKDKVVATIRFNVASGTYIRSLAKELGLRLGYPATIKNLRRTKVGEFNVYNAKSLS